jgi:UDP-glucose 4-epimerase
MQTVLITGGAGFIGSHLVDRLLADGHRVIVLDDFSSGRQENLDDARLSGNLRVIEGSVLDLPKVERAMEGCDRVYHLAVQCVRRSLGRPLENHEVNATGTLMVLEAARRHQVARFIYCSSSEVYGNSDVTWMNEETTRCNPVTVYGAAKLAGEYYAKAYWQTYGLPVVIVRPFNSYGPREHERGDLAEVIPRFVIRALNGLPPIIFGTGKNRRDFTYIVETVRGIVMAADCDALLGRTVNIAYGRAVTIKSVAETVATLCGHPELRPQYVEPRPGDVHALQADIRLACTMLGFRAEIGLEQGLRRYIDWFTTRHNDLAGLLEDEVRNWEIPPAGEQGATVERC